MTKGKNSFLALLRRHVKVLKILPNDEAVGLCPFHPDKKPSFSANVEKGVWLCRACGAKGNAKGFARRIKERGGEATHREGKPFVNSKSNQKTHKKQQDKGYEDPNEGFTNTNVPEEDLQESGFNLAQYAEAKQLPAEFLKGLGLGTTFISRIPAVRIPVLDPEGNEAAVCFRMALIGDGRFRWRKGSKALPYGLNRLGHARQEGRITLVEGFSDAQTLWFHEEPALGFPGATTWNESWADYLDGIDNISIVIEPDTGGEAVKKWLSKSSIRDRARIVRLEDAKDVSDLHLQGRDQFKPAWAKILRQAIPWNDLESAERQQEAQEVYQQAKELLKDPKLLERVGKVMQEFGYAGDTNPPLLVYLALTSRLLNRPINLSLVAPSAAGKNFTVDTAVPFFPPEAIYHFQAGSPRALVYTDEDFEHRTVIVGEADSIPSEGSGASAVRSIAEDNFMSYEVTIKDPKTGKFRTHKIVKPGPTGMLTTSVKRLDEQMSTRMMEMTLPDDPVQTRKILEAQARFAAGKSHDADAQLKILTPFIALQKWLELAGTRRVVIPFSPILAQKIPAEAVRMRRDHKQLLTCIQAIAMLHQEQRDRDGASVMATLDDYALARGLLAPLFDVIAAEGVTRAIRETAEAVTEVEEISVSQLAKRLGIHTSTTHWRVRRCLEGGWLVNKEHRPNHAAILSKGAPLPADKSALPEVAEVEEAFTIVKEGHSKPPSKGLNTEKKEENGEGYEVTNDFEGDSSTPPPSPEENLMEEELVDPNELKEIPPEEELVDPEEERFKKFLARKKRQFEQEAIEFQKWLDEQELVEVQLWEPLTREFRSHKCPADWLQDIEELEENLYRGFPPEFVEAIKAEENEYKTMMENVALEIIREDDIERSSGTDH